MSNQYSLQARADLLQERVDVAKQRATNGLTRDLAMFVLEDTHFLDLANVGSKNIEEEFISSRKEMVLQAFREEGFYFDLASGKFGQPIPEGVEPGEAGLLRHYLEKAKKDPLFFEGTIQACIELLQVEACSLGNVLGPWLVEVMKGNIKPTKPRGPDPLKNVARDDTIFIAVRTLASVGYSPTRNNASAPNSACDYVAEALGRLAGIGLSYDAVAKIYSKEARMEASRD
ncbi:hypothetical protein AB0T83_18505 [Fluviibacterium sp. DFM31]|uniref:Uncharacterized protein n=1 Tax=Meridianimarinicoccus marinus TaxID=3231483 RepID=A0ABV3LBF4_9RHOB